MKKILKSFGDLINVKPAINVKIAINVNTAYTKLSKIVGVIAEDVIIAKDIK
jgi:hypothetical protein